MSQARSGGAVAAIQMVSGAEVAANLAAAAQLIAEAARGGAQLVVLPENFAIMARNDIDRLAVGEDDGAGPIQDFLAAQARAHRLWIVGGTVPIRAEAPGKLRAASPVYNERGERVARYDKIHLFDVTLANGEQYRESATFDAGHEPVVVDTPVGRLGLSVCYDLRFPELYRRLLDLGAELLTAPAAFTAITGRAHWEVLVRARAIENLCYMVAAGQGGMHANGRATHGDSMIVNPWGEVLARQAQGAGVVRAQLDLAQLREWRMQLPSIAHRRLKA